MSDSSNGREDDVLTIVIRFTLGELHYTHHCKDLTIESLLAKTKNGQAYANEAFTC